MNILRRKASRLIAAAVMTGTGLGLASIATSTTAHADPSSTHAFNFVGSDTLQDWFDGVAGGPIGPNNQFYTPISATNATTGVTWTVASWDALNRTGNVTPGTFPSCITTTFGGPTFDRPNGSGAGRTALLNEINSVAWSDTNVGTAQCQANSAVQLGTSVDGARSSSLSGTAGTALAYDPVAQDGVTYAYYCVPGGNAADCAAVAHLATGVLTSLYANGNNGSLTPLQSGLTADTLKACTMNNSSGTYGFWATRMGLASAGAADANVNATGCGVTAGNGRIEENALNSFETSAASVGAAGQDFVIPMSIGNVVGQHNGVSPDASSAAFAAGARIGNVDSLGTGANGFPYNNDNGNYLVYNGGGNGAVLWSPNTPYNQSNYGRYLFVVLNAAKINGSGPLHIGADANLRALFAGATSKICTLAGAGVATQALFGFDAVSHNGTQPAVTGCGDTTSILRGA